jgi:hypothetical protein
MRGISCCIGAALVCLVSAGAAGQAPTAPTFEVASVKQSNSDSSSSSSKDSPGSYAAINMPLRETREGAVLALVRARTDGAPGTQLGLTSLDCSKPEACGLISTVDGNGGVLRGGGQTMTDLAENLTGRVNQPVIDRTGLTGRYDFVLRWTPDNFQNATGKSGPSTDGTPIVTALREQLGLKLEPQRAPVEFLIIDRIERPSPD